MFRGTGMSVNQLSSEPAPLGRCKTCQFWKQDFLAEHRGHGIRGQVLWGSCTQGGYLAARTGNPFTSEDFGCFLWEGTTLRPAAR